MSRIPSVRVNGHAVKALRRYARFTLESLADYVEISAAHLSYIEREERRPSVSLTRRIAHALDVPVAAIRRDPVDDQDDDGTDDDEPLAATA